MARSKQSKAGKGSSKRASRGAPVEEEEEEEVFELALPAEPEDDDSMEVDDEQEEDEDEDEEENELRELVNALPARLRQKVLKKGAAEEDSEEEAEAEEDEGWGAKKKAYYSGDTADLEIGQDAEDAKDEEEAALELRAKTLTRMQESDYYDEEEAPAPARGSSSKSKRGGRSDPLMSHLEDLALATSKAVDPMKIVRDASKMTEAMRMKMIASESPEFFPLITEVRERVAELQERVNPIMATESHESSDKVVQYLHVRQQLLLAYCTNVVFYMLLKAEGRSVRSHPVMKQLLEIRNAIEKLHPIDDKLEYKVDRLLEQLSSGEGDDDEEMEAVPSKKGGRKDGVFKAPKIAAAPKRVKKSEIFEALRGEFGSTPEVASSTSAFVDTVEQRRLEKEADERRDFEEDRFVRLSRTKKEKKDGRRREKEAGRFDTIDKFGDIGDFEEVNDVVGVAVVEAAGARKKGFIDASMEKAMRGFEEAGGMRSADLDSFASMLEAGPEKKKARRPAPESSMDFDAPEEEGMLEAFSKHKKAFKDLKVSHYTAEPKYGGIEEAVEPGAKRAASYEIMKNKGLTPHRKKANRNPRVKKREAYDKAVIRRKGQVREAVSGVGSSYGGEMTGIKMNIARSRKIGN